GEYFLRPRIKQLTLQERDVTLTNKGWVDGNGSNLGSRFGKPGGGRETYGGGDGLEGPGGQLSMV
ncbi:hypothetical protein Tco_0759348, partial [Tanacetum coccineum]